MIITEENILRELKGVYTPLSFSYVFRSEKDKGFISNNEVKVKLIQNGEIITIPKGMYWDLSSVPKFLWPVLPPYGDFLFASKVHDYLYRSQHHLEEMGAKEARAFADREMLLWSDITNGGRKIDNRLRYRACRWFGAKVYRTR